MTVQELIDELAEFDGQLEVLITVEGSRWYYEPDKVRKGKAHTLVVIEAKLEE